MKGGRNTSHRVLSVFKVSTKSLMYWLSNPHIKIKKQRKIFQDSEEELRALYTPISQCILSMYKVSTKFLTLKGNAALKQLFLF